MARVRAVLEYLEGTEAATRKEIASATGLVPSNYLDAMLAGLTSMGVIEASMTKPAQYSLSPSYRASPPD